MPEQVNPYTEILSLEGEARQEAVDFANLFAFYHHLEKLGERQDTAPDLPKGDTRISIPAYFRLPKTAFATNPVNEAALALLPSYEYRSAYGNSIDTIVHEKEWIEALGMNGNGVAFARTGKATQFIVAKALGLNSESVRGAYIDAAFYKKQGLVNRLVAEISRDLDEQVTGDVSDIAHRVKEKGYHDFLDYLLDAQTTIRQRVETVFEHGPNQE